MNSNFQILQAYNVQSDDYELSNNSSPELFFFFARRYSGEKLNDRNYGFPKYDTGELGFFERVFL